MRPLKLLPRKNTASHIGVTRKTINTIESGKIVPSTILAIKLARFFEIKVEELFTLNDN
ncbi:MAG TPA: helix-turn-helix domain-containing protein [Prolixibacteraceae bacterium]|nr:helix-turn-helix domain-containing protein [Prolixibacteraceae bacterium]